MPARLSRRGCIASCLEPWVHWTALVAALGVLLATAWAYVHGALGYVDNGDGYYLYAARRVAGGATLYRDVMGTQPPVVYLLGAAAFKLGASLQCMRLLSAVMRLLATGLVYVIGRRLYMDRVTAALAALLYALLPIGLFWDRSFDVNPPLTLAALLSAATLLRDTRRSALGSGLLAALALCTKNLYVPLLVATLVYLAVHHRRLLAPYLRGLLCGLAVLAGALVAYAGPGGLRDAFLGQEGSPLNPAWFIAAAAYVATAEGGVLLAALLGSITYIYPGLFTTETRRHGECGVSSLCLRVSVVQSVFTNNPGYDRRDARRPHPQAPKLTLENAHAGTAGAPRSAYGPWLLAGSAAVLMATLKEGTAGPVFQFAEPAVALLAAYGMSRAVRPPIRPLLWLAPAALLLSLPSIVGADRAALTQDNAPAVARIVALIHARAPRGTAIVAPPYYALLSGTRLPGDMADTYILAQRARRGDPAATAWVRGVTVGIAARRIPVVLVDLRLAAIPPLMAALRRYYHPIYSDPLPSALHVVVWYPDRR